MPKMVQIKAPAGIDAIRISLNLAWSLGLAGDSWETSVRGCGHGCG